MISVKINKNNFVSGNFEKTIKNIVSFFYKTLNLNAKVISDNQSTEINFGKQESTDDDFVTVELTLKKNIKIKKSDFNNRDQLHSFISTIKNFCEKAYEIESYFEGDDFIRSKHKD